MEATTQASAQAEEATRLGVETLRGDIRDRILDDIARGIPGWTSMSERDQRRIIDKAASISIDLVRESVRIVAHQGFAHLIVSTGKWTVKDGIKLEVGAPGSVDDITKLAEHGARSAVLVLAEPSVFFGQRTEAVADKDEPELPIHDADGVIQDEVTAEQAESEGGDNPLPERTDLPEPPAEETTAEQHAFDEQPTVEEATTEQPRRRRVRALADA